MVISYVKISFKTSSNQEYEIRKRFFYWWHFFALFETLFLKRCQIFVRWFANLRERHKKSFLLAFIIKPCCLVLLLLSNKDMLSIKIDRFLYKSYFLLRLLKCLPASGYRRNRLIALVMAILDVKFPNFLSKLDKIFDQKSTYSSKDN